MAGNVYDWTADTIGANQQPGLFGEATYSTKQWNNGVLLMNGLPYNSQPASTGIAGVSGWSSTPGIGILYSVFLSLCVDYFFGGQVRESTMFYLV